MRVVLIWAPLGWLLHKRIWGELRPWIIASAITAVLGTVLGLLYFKEAILLFWILYLVTLALGGSAVFVICLADKYSKTANWILFLLLSPAIVPLIMIANISSFAWKRVLEPVYFRRYKRLWVTWIVTLVAISGVIYAV